jgi:phosphonate transport system ATP-binding protein
MNDQINGRVDEAASNAETVISIRNLSHTYKRGNLTVFEDVDLDIGKGENIVLLGPSGGGKSTLLRCINRLVKATSGTINVFGTEMVAAPFREVRKARRDIGMVFQSFNLIERISVLDNVLIGRLGYLSTARSIFGLYQKEDIAESLHALDRVNLTDFSQQLAMNLSGGQRQRVAIARALAQRPGFFSPMSRYPISTPCWNGKSWAFCGTFAAKTGSPALPACTMLPWLKNSAHVLSG